MIVQLRLDERLIHGQITTAWSKFFDVGGIVVANDKLAKNELATQTLLMAAPAGKKVAVRGIQDAIKLLKDPRGKKIRILLIVDNPTDAVAMVEALNIQEINVANYVKIIDVIESYYGIKLDSNSVYYERFLTHLKYFYARVLKNEMSSDHGLQDDFVFRILKTQYRDAAKCADLIGIYLNSEYDIEITEEEKGYLIIHIMNLVNKTKK